MTDARADPADYLREQYDLMLAVWVKLYPPPWSEALQAKAAGYRQAILDLEAGGHWSAQQAQQEGGR
jgi:hypothetical protein